MIKVFQFCIKALRRLNDDIEDEHPPLNDVTPPLYVNKTHTRSHKSGEIAAYKNIANFIKEHLDANSSLASEYVIHIEGHLFPEVIGDYVQLENYLLSNKNMVSEIIVYELVKIKKLKIKKTLEEVKQ